MPVATKFRRDIRGIVVELDLQEHTARFNGETVERHTKNSCRAVFIKHGIVVKIDRGALREMDRLRNTDWQCETEGQRYAQVCKDNSWVKLFMAEVLDYGPGWCIQEYHEHKTVLEHDPTVEQLVTQIVNELKSHDAGAFHSADGSLTLYNCGIRPNGLPIIFDYGL